MDSESESRAQSRAQIERLEAELHAARNQLAALVLLVDNLREVLAESPEELDQICPQNLPDIVEALVEDHAALSERLDQIDARWRVFRTENVLDGLVGLDALAEAIEPVEQAQAQTQAQISPPGRSTKDWNLCPFESHADDCDCRGMGGNR